MAYAFDTLGYAKRLRDGRILASEVETHAEAAREFIMTELVTRTHLEAARRELNTCITSLQQRREHRMDSLEFRLMVRSGDMMAGMMALSVGVLAAVIKL